MATDPIITPRDVWIPLTELERNAESIKAAIQARFAERREQEITGEEE
jgi:hypothetical protein